MRNNWSYKTRLLLYFTAAFTLFAVVIIFLQFRQDRITKQENLHYRLSGYADIISRSGEYAVADTLLLPAVRITVIGVDGDVVYDAAGSSLENHSHRPEVRDAMLEGSGYSIRHSATTGKDYFYYADYVVTDTFHGTVIAAKMNTPFATIVRESNRNKLEDLIRRLGMQRRMITDISDLEQVLLESVDFEPLNAELARQRVLTQNYLKNNV